LATVRAIRQRDSSTPIAVLSGLDDEMLAIEALKMGAQDYLPKAELSRSSLRRLVRYSIERQRHLDVIKKTNQALNSLNAELEEKNKLLSELSITDELTGLFNRRHICELLDRAHCQYHRCVTPYGCLIIDLDHFKQINDRHGHDAGDLVLRGIAEVLKSCTRASDVCGRYGGEEFLMLTYADAESIVPFAERILGRIRNHRVLFKEQQLQITASIGAAVVMPQFTVVDRIITAADQALYEAKRAGRDRIHVYAHHETAAVQSSSP
jgi:two-component system cell cycle response regulator